MFGPILNRGIISQSTANTFDSTFNTENLRTLTMANTGGQGTYTAGELVYEGRTLNSANVTALVKSWSPDINKLVLTSVSGVLQTGRFLKGVDSNATYNIANFATADSQLSNIIVTPNPPSANITTAFGYDTQFNDFPNL